jgi:hypothetical protein
MILLTAMGQRNPGDSLIDERIARFAERGGSAEYGASVVDL